MSGRKAPLLFTVGAVLLLFYLSFWLPVRHAAAQTTVPGVVTRNANLRAGPGTTYAVVGGVKAGVTVYVVEATADQTWYYLDSGNWIAAFLVQLSAPLEPGETLDVGVGAPAGIFTTVITTVVTTVTTTVSTTALVETTAPPVPNPSLTLPLDPAPTVPLDPFVPPASAGQSTTAPVALPPVSATVVVSTLLPSDAQSATLVSVLEGDVIEVDVGGVRELVRYLGIDAPDAGQPGFETAASFNRSAVAGQELLLQREQTDRDAQNRLLRHVYVVDRSLSTAFNGAYAGRYINAQLVADGWALPATAAPDISKAPEIESWALDAARSGRGFWGGRGGNDNAVYALTLVNAPLFSGPGANNGADAVLAVDLPLNVVGRSQDGAWIEARTPRGDQGWIFVPQVNLTAPISRLPVTSSGASGPTPAPQPGQAVVAPQPGQVIVATPLPGQPPLPDPSVPAPAPGAFGPSVIANANLRSGPGTVYPAVGTALANAPITITARNADGRWLQTDGGVWIAAGLVSGVTAATLPQFDAAPPPAATVTPGPTPVLIVPPGVTAPTPTITPTPSPTATPLGNPTPTFTPLPPQPLVRLIALDRGNEWAILYNDGTGTQDLTGWVLVSEAGDQRCPLQGTLVPRESLRVWAQVGPDGFSCGFPEPIWENAGPDAAVLLNAYGDEVSRIQ